MLPESLCVFVLFFTNKSLDFVYARKVSTHFTAIATNGAEGSGDNSVSPTKDRVQEFLTTVLKIF